MLQQCLLYKSISNNLSILSAMKKGLRFLGCFLPKKTKTNHKLIPKKTERERMNRKRMKTKKTKVRRAKFDQG